MSKRFSFILTWSLLLAFGVPSIGGRGLHLFLDGLTSDGTQSCCSVHRHRTSDHDDGDVYHGGDAHHDADAHHGGETPHAADVSSLPINAGETEDSFPNLTSSPLHHDADHCFLCQFLIQPQETPSEWDKIIDFRPAERVVHFTPLISFCALPLHSGRGPPLLSS